MNADVCTGSDRGRIKVVTEVQRGWQSNPQERLGLIKQTFERGMTVAAVTETAGISATQSFHWYDTNLVDSLVTVAPDAPIVSASEVVKALKQIKQLVTLLGWKAAEKEILKESAE